MNWDLLLSAGLGLIFLPVLLLMVIFRTHYIFFFKSFLNKKYFRQIVLLVTTCYFAVILIFTSYSLTFIEQNIRTEAGSSLKAVNASTEHAMRLWGDAALRAVHHLTSEAELHEIIQQAQTDVAQASINFADIYTAEMKRIGASNLVVRTQQGKTVVSIQPDSTETWNEAWQLAALQNASNSEAIYHPPVIEMGSSSEHHLFYFISAFKHPAHSEALVLVASFESISAFSAFTEIAKKSGSGETYVIDNQGRIITTSRFTTELSKLASRYLQFKNRIGWHVRDPGFNLMTEELVEIDFTTKPLTLAAQGVVSGRSDINIDGYRDYRGVRVIGAWNWSPELQLALVTEIDETEALAPFYKLKQLVLGALFSIIVITLILLIVILWLGERIAANLRQIVSESHHQLESTLQQLETSEFTRTLALEAAQIGLWHFDVKNGLWWWDDRCSEIAGVDQSQKNALFLKSILHPDDRACLSFELRQAIERQTNFDVEFRIVSSSGEIRYLRARASAKPTEQFGLRVYGILLDVTDIKRTEENTRQIRERNQLILNYAGEGIIGLDLEGKISFCNAAAKQMLGYSEDELVGHDMHPLVHYAYADGSDYPAQKCPMRLSAQLGETRHVETDVLWHKSGQQFPVEYTAVPLKQNDQVLGSVVVFRDITERKLNEQKIIAREQQISKILEASPDPLIITDHQARIVSINKRTEQIFGYSREQLIGQHIEILIPERFRQGHVAMRDGFIHKPEARLFSQTSKGRSFIAITAQGHEFPIELSLNPMETEDGLFIVSAVHDLTERQHAEQQLRSREERFALSTAGSGDGLWDFNLIEHQYWYSDRFKTLLGYAELNISAGIQAWFDLVHPDDAFELHSLFEAHLHQNTSFDVQHRLRCADQTWRWFRAKGQALRDADNQAYRVAGSITDITDLRQMQELINAERQQLQTILDVSPIGVGITVDGIVRFANPQFLSMVDTQIGKPVKDIYVRQAERERILSLVELDGKAMDLETQMYDSAGNIRDILISYLPVSFKGESGVLGWLFDITERKRIEQQIFSSEARLQAASIAANLGLWDYSPANRELLTNSNWVTMFGYASTSFLQELPEENGKWLRFKGGIDQWINLLNPDDVRANPASFFQVEIPLQDMFRGEYRVRCANGVWRWALVAGQVIERDEHGQAIRIVGILSDIDDEKNLQHALIAARDEAQEATRTKSDFLANMSHEIRTPMNAIIGMSHLALQTELSKKQRNYIDKVKQSAESLLGVINDILDFSKIEAGRLSIEHIEFRLEDVLDNLTTLINYKAETKGLELLFDIGSDVPVALIGDPLRLGQVLVNLGNNAVKFTQHGEVVISVRLTACEAKRCQLEFLVRDTGIGLSTEQQSRLFRSFSQADSSTTRKFGGTGLGLAISKNLVDLMGGNIWVESTQGVGSTFGFRLGFDIQELPKPVTRKYLPELDGTRVLVVDDNKTAGEILTTMLRAMQFQVDYFNSAVDALSAIQQASIAQPYKLLVMDWKMPGMSGIELAKELEYNLQLSNTPSIILVTAYSRDEAMEAAKDLHIQSFLNKPVTTSSLLDAIMTAVGHDVVIDSRTQLKYADIQYAVDALFGAHVLLVEDNEVNQELAVELLEAQGIKVTIANHGQEALDHLALGTFDGVLMDCQMPIMDGYTATKLIRQQPKFAHLPIIAMTANAMAGDRELVIAAGMNDHIPKPINVHEMFETMARWISPTKESSKVRQTFSTERMINENFPAIPGINVQQGLQRTLNKPDLYRKLLLKTLQSQSSFVEDYMLAKQNETRLEQIRLVHSLKGVAGNIAAEQLASACQEVESKLQNSEDVTAAEQEMLQLFETMSLALHDFVQEIKSEPVITAVHADPHEILNIIVQLIQLASEFDTELVTQFEQHAASIQQISSTDIFNRLRFAIAQYDFSGAENLLTMIKSNLSE